MLSDWLRCSCTSVHCASHSPIRVALTCQSCNNPFPRKAPLLGLFLFQVSVARAGRRCEARCGAHVPKRTLRSSRTLRLASTCQPYPDSSKKSRIRQGLFFAQEAGNDYLYLNRYNDGPGLGNRHANY